MATPKSDEEWTLLQELYTIAMDRTEEKPTRLTAAKTIMPYLYRKMPVSSEVEIKGNDGIIAALKEIYGTTTPATTEGGQNTPQTGE